MRPLALAIATASALLGCTNMPRVESAGPAPEPPLRVWIGFPVGSARTHPIFVNREAHVAMFEIIPGLGATLVYPRYRAEDRASVTHRADLMSQPGRGFYHPDPFGYASFAPRYYYVIASTEPLAVSRLYTSPALMRRMLGQTYASYDAYRVIDRLTELVVPMQADEDWATDLFIDWPTPRMPTRRAFAYRFVRCANGRVFPVLGDYPYFGCPGDARLAVAPDSVKRPVTALPREPKQPRVKDPIEAGERRGGEVDNRRRAMGSARPPRADRGRTGSSSEGIRYSDDRRGRGGNAEPARASAPARGESTREVERTAPVQRSDPPREPSPRGERSGGERKPDPK